MEEKYSEIIKDLAPTKSIKIYEKFMQFLQSQNTENITEKALLVYFGEMNKKGGSPASLWSKYSMLKTMLNIKMNVDLAKFHTLKALLKNYNKGYKPKKATTFTKEQFDTFIKEATDSTHLLHKVILIMGISGGLRRVEVYNLRVHDVIDEQTRIRVKSKDRKNYTDSEFFVYDSNEISYAGIIQSYMKMRPKTPRSNFLLAYNKGKISNLPVGINNVGGVPALVANYLGLSDPEKYTGHSLRRTSMTLLANSGANIVLQIKKHGSFKSNSVPEQYVDHTDVIKEEAAQRILNLPGTSSSHTILLNKKDPDVIGIEQAMASKMVFNNCTVHNFHAK